MARENSQLKKTVAKLAMLARANLKPNDGTTSLSHTDSVGPEAVGTNTSENPRGFIPSEVTILLLKHLNQASTFAGKIREIKRLFPINSVKVTWDDKSGSVGKSLNRMVKEIKTEYFMILEAKAFLSDAHSEGIDTLWDALERYPEIDFIGGSYLSGDKFYITCQRYRFCNWTYSESYEYQRSHDNVMICDGTSASFMGRTKSMTKIEHGFDENMPNVMVLKDFFVRAKAANVVVATKPAFVLLTHGFQTLYDRWQNGDITKDLLPFAIKYKVFIFKDEDGNTIDLCATTSPLSGKDVCVETNAHKEMLNGGHWAHLGLYTYPFLLEYLKVTLREVVDFFEEHNVNYILFGGVSLGAVKMHSILPWEAGDIDIRVYGMDVPQLLNLFRPWATKMGYVLREHRESKAVHVFCTPKEIGDVSGGLASIFPTHTPPEEYVKIKTNGFWVRYSRNLFQHIIKRYGQGYLQHKMYRTNSVTHCKVKGHNACLPNFQSMFDGKAGTYREYFCQN